MSDLKRKVFITGAGGRIGSRYARHAHERYDLHLMIEHEGQRSTVDGLGAVHVLDLADQAGMLDAMRGCDTVVHLAATPDVGASWDAVRRLNIEGTYNAMEAAVGAGCRRVICASSIHAVTGHPMGQPVGETDAGQPRTLYGVSKCFAEAMCSYLAQARGMSAMAIRIGGYNELDQLRRPSGRPRGAYVNGFIVVPDDLHRLIDHAVAAPDDVRFAVLHGTSLNQDNRLSYARTSQLTGWEPKLKVPPPPPPTDRA